MEHLEEFRFEALLKIRTGHFGGTHQPERERGAIEVVAAEEPVATGVARGLSFCRIEQDKGSLPVMSNRPLRLNPARSLRHHLPRMSFAYGRLIRL